MYCDRRKNKDENCTNGKVIEKFTSLKIPHSWLYGILILHVFISKIRYINMKTECFVCDSYMTAMEKEMAPFYSKVNGVSSATNGQCVVINETRNMVFADNDQVFVDNDQVKHTDQISMRNPVIEANQDTTDTSRVRTASARRKSIVSLSEIDLKPSKLVLIVGICCIIGLAVPPIILHFIQIDSQSHDDLYTSNNFSMVNVIINIQ